MIATTARKTKSVAKIAALAIFSLVLIVMRSEFWRAQPLRLQTCGVVATHASNFVAVLVERELAKHGFDVTVLAVPPTDYTLDVYFLLNPHEFASLPMPPASKLVVFRAASIVRLDPLFFTPDYVRLLKRSRAVVEHELEAIEATRAVLGGAIPVSYVPIGASRSDLPTNDGYAGTLAAASTTLSMRSHAKFIDVIVSGDFITNPRRARFLAAMKQSVTVKVVPSATALADASKHARLCVIVRETVHDLLDFPLIQV